VVPLFNSIFNSIRPQSSPHGGDVFDEELHLLEELEDTSGHQSSHERPPADREDEQSALKQAKIASNKDAGELVSAVLGGVVMAQDVDVGDMVDDGSALKRIKFDSRPTENDEEEVEVEVLEEKSPVQPRRGTRKRGLSLVGRASKRV